MRTFKSPLAAYNRPEAADLSTKKCNRKESMKTLKDIDVSNKSVVIRCDFNVPMEGTRITDNSKSLSLIKPFYFMSEETDYKHISGGHLTLANWLSCLHKTNSFFILNKRDIKPGLVYFALTFCRMIKRLIKK